MVRRIFAVVASAGLLWGMGLTGAAVATTGTPQPETKPSAEIGDQDCQQGGFNIFLDNSESDTQTTYKIKFFDTGGGGKLGGAQVETVPAGESTTVVATHPELTEDREIRIRVDEHGEGGAIGLAERIVTLDCVVNGAAADVLDENCEIGGFDVLLDNSTEESRRATFRVKVFGEDGKLGPAEDHHVDAGETETVPVETPEDTEVRIRVEIANQLTLTEETVTLDCEEDTSPSPSPTDDPKGELTEVVPEKPGVNQPTCESPGAIVIPDVEGVQYMDGTGEPVEPAAYAVGEAGDYRAIAEPEQGFEFPEGATAEWILTVNEAPSEEECEEPGTTPAASEDKDAGGMLPFTGSPLRLIAAVALALIAAGGLTLGGLRLTRTLRSNA